MGVILIRDPVIYNGWRHVFFLYPMLVIFMIECLKRLWSLDINHNHHQILNGVRIIIVSLVVFQLSNVVLFMIDSHPYEHVYYNRLAGKTLADARLNYNMDYWSLSTKEALENLLQIDNSKNILVNFGGFGDIDANRRLLKEGSEWILIVSLKDKADYFITDFRNGLEMEFPGRVMISNIKVRDAVISATYKYE